MSGRAQPIAHTLARLVRGCVVPLLALIAVIAVAQCDGSPEPVFSIAETGEM